MNVPRATYRLQFREGMDFDRAAALVPYFERLGVSHLYASPIFTAPEGSTHGYDVADANEIDPSLGGRPGFDRLSAALKRAGIGLLLDIVPNHMAASLENPWWRSVVEWGAESPTARHFDIDWRERLTLPILGKLLDEAMRDGELGLRLDAQAGTLALAYYETLLPLHPKTYALALDGLDDPVAAGLLAAAVNAEPGNEGLHERVRAVLAGKDAASALQAELDARSGDWKHLAAVHDAQPWRLIFWKDAQRHLSYRRFFEVTGLAGVRVEDPAVFADVHRLTLKLVRSGQVDGLRVDHVDGLADPRGYLEELRAAAGPDVFIVVEKILGEGEPLPADWPVEGTTGYEFAAAMPGLFVDRAGSAKLAAAFDAVRGEPFDMEAERRKAKTAMVTRNFETELSTLARMAAKLADADSRSLGEDALRDAIVALIVSFPVYRTYGNAGGISDADRTMLGAVAAKARAGGAAGDALDFVLALLLRDAGDVEFRTRFQQLTGPATAKSVEDTLFYRANALIGLNEVGGDPAQETGSVARFHAAMLSHRERQPHGLLATATHDTKRGEDARARLYALSEAPEAWAEAVGRWRGMMAKRVRHGDGAAAPEPETEWLLFQALAGIWPMEPGVPSADDLGRMSERFSNYAEKALREAKLRTNWGDPDADYEEAVKGYAAALLDPANSAFLADFDLTLRPFVEAGKRNSLCQTLLKLTAPGVPDIYQGTEGWDLSLVDPDNRRPPRFDAFSGELDRLEEHGDDGDKLGLIAAVLKLRREEPQLFAEGSYQPLEVEGGRAGNVAAFLREHGDEAVLAVVSRFGLRDGDADWTDTLIRLPAQARKAWVCVFTGRRFDAGRPPAAEVLHERPYALLRREPD